MNRTRILLLLGWLVGVLLLTGCGGQRAPVAVQPTAAATATPTAAPTATPTPDLASIWQQANRGGADATALLYFGQNSESAPPLALWRMPLDGSGQPKKVADGLQGDFDVSAAHLSADEQWTAYLEGRDRPLTLHVMDVNGENDQILSTTIGSHSPGCSPGYVWSYTGTRLAFREPNPAGTEPGTRLFVYDPTSDTAPTQVVRFTTSSKFVGWQDDENLFMLVLAEYKQPLQLEQIVIATGERRVVTSLPNNETVYCARPSPDGRYILFGMETETYLFDVTARTLTPIDVAARRAIWAYDAEALLTFSLNTEVAIVPLTNTAETAGITAVSIELKPPSGPRWISGTLNTSPDGQWLVGCFGYATNQHAWLYHLPTQTWQQLAHGCIEVVGWSTR